MIDPVNCTDFARDQYALEEFAVFCLCVANKTAKVIAPAVGRMLASMKGETPFEKLKKLSQARTVANCYTYGMGCQQMKGRGLFELSRSGLDLRTCSVADLEAVYGIGQKTSRYFVLHTRPDQQHIPLDTHMLKFLVDEGVDNVPKSAPGSAKRYAELEALALSFAKKRSMTPADFDLNVWRFYSGNAVEGVNNGLEVGPSVSGSGPSGKHLVKRSKYADRGGNHRPRRAGVVGGVQRTAKRGGRLAGAA